MSTFVIIYWDGQNVSLGFSYKMVQKLEQTFLANPVLPCVARKTIHLLEILRAASGHTLTERSKAAVDTLSVAITHFNQLEKLTWMRITVLAGTRHRFFSITFN